LQYPWPGSSREQGHWDRERRRNGGHEAEKQVSGAPIKKTSFGLPGPGYCILIPKRSLSSYELSAFEEVRRKLLLFLSTWKEQLNHKKHIEHKKIKKVMLVK
jgi:hypothetical protein